jgi:hypothetical protein
VHTLLLCMRARHGRVWSLAGLLPSPCERRLRVYTTLFLCFGTFVTDRGAEKAPSGLACLFHLEIAIHGMLQYRLLLLDGR